MGREEKDSGERGQEKLAVMNRQRYSRSRTDDGERTVMYDRPPGEGRASPSNIVAGHKCTKKG